MAIPSRYWARDVPFEILSAASLAWLLAKNLLRGGVVRDRSGLAQSCHTPAIGSI
jgi:hypothetical protein